MSLVPRQVSALAQRPAEQVTEAWLANRRLSEHTRAAYRRDVAGWLSWCAERDLDPLAASFLDVNAYARGLESSKLAPSTVARKMSGLSSWYEFLVKLRAIDANPVAGADRPPVARDHSATVGLTADEVDALIAAADGPRNRAMILLLADLGLRVGELVGLDVTLQAMIAPEQVDILRDKGGAVGECIHAISSHYGAHYSRRTGREGFPMHDSAAVLYAIAPDYFSTEHWYLEVETTSQRAAGMVMTDRRGRWGRPTNATVCVGIDAGRFLRLYLDRLTTDG